MKLRKLKWIFSLGLVGFFLFMEFASQTLGPSLGTRPGRLLLQGVVLVGCLFLLGLAFDLGSRMNSRLERQNRELLALHRAARDIYGNLSLDTVLTKVVEQAAALLEARYGAIAVYDESGQIREFITTGISAEDRDKVGAPPVGKGLLSIPMRRGETLRLADISQDERAAGLPPHHPPMTTLLAVPIRCKGPFRGNLYLAEKMSAPQFLAEDEDTLVRFSTAASIAIDNAHLHQRLRALAVAEERVRIAREMHDGMAQVLAYVNTKAQAVKEFLRRERIDDASQQLEQLAKAAREVHVDVREQIVGLRNQLGAGSSLEQELDEFLRRWREQSGLKSRFSLSARLEEFSPMAQLQLLRIVQEALSNVRKHAQAKEARVTIEQIGDRLVAVVEDDGIGFDPEARSSSDLPRFGLAIMRERAESIAARLVVDSEPGRGTRIRVEVPTAAARRRAERPGLEDSLPAAQA